MGVAGLAALPLTAAAGTTAHAHETTTADERGPDPDQLSEAPAMDAGQDTFRADDLVAGTLAPTDPRDRTGLDDTDGDHTEARADGAAQAPLAGSGGVDSDLRGDTGTGARPDGTRRGDTLGGDAADDASGGLPGTTSRDHVPDAGRPHAGGGAGEPAVSTHAAPSSAVSRAPEGTVPGQARRTEAERPRGPLTALVDGLVGPTGLLGGDGLLAGLVGGVVDGPLVAVDAEVSPQVQVGGVLSGGPVTQSTTRTG
ncbi:hypothetical protein CFP66_34895 [Pseudonocardia sp. MH-G8]|nr:hypothetical protein CFP66_34895 [Pseudonocardia sp. MH-G8]